jgi:hypothetical protein
MLHTIRAVREVAVPAGRRSLITAFSIVAILVGCLPGAVRGDHASYLGGTVTAIPKGTLGKLNLEDAAELRFEYKGGVFSVPYKRARGIFRVVLPTLEAKTGKRAEIDMAYAGGLDDDWGGQSRSSEVRHGVDIDANIPPEQRRYPVSILSDRQALRLSWG